MSKITAVHFIAATVLILILAGKAEAEPDCVRFIDNMEWRDGKRSQCRVYSDEYRQGALGMSILCTRGPDYWYWGDLFVNTNATKSHQCDIAGGNLIRTSDQSYSPSGYLTHRRAVINLRGEDGRLERIRARR